MASGKAALLLWTQNRTKGYNKVNITNFHTSWTDGLAFCALIHSHRPDLIDFSSLSPSNASENLRIAFSTAESLGIPRLLEVEDMVLVSKPEPLSIMTYLSQMYHYFKANPDGKSATVKPTSAGIASIVFEKDSSESKETLPATRNRSSSSDAAAASQSLKPKSTTGNGTTWTRSEVSPKCARCHNPLSGVTVEAAGGMYHQDCFGCTQCGTKLDRVCLNVNNKPYCERCGRVAFVLKNRESMSLSSNKVKQLSQSTQEVQSLHGDGKPAETTKTETKKTEATKESSSSSSSNSSSNSTSSTLTSDMGAPKPLPKKKSKKTKPKGLSDDQPNLSSSSSSSSSLDSTPTSSATDKPDSETKPPKSKKQKNTGAPTSTSASGSASTSASTSSSSSGSESGSASPATIKKKKSTKTTEGSSYKPKKASALAASSENPENNGTNGSGSGDSRRSRSSRQKGSEKTASKPSRTSSSKTKKVRQPRSQNQSEECTSRLRHAKSLPVVLERPTAPFDTSSTTSNPSDFSQVPFSSSSTSSTSSSSSFAAGGQPNVVDAISCSAPDPTLHHLYSMQNVNFDLDSNSSNVFGAQDLGSPVSGSPLLSYHHYLNRTSGEASFDSLLFPSGGESSDDTTTSDDQIDGSSSSSITTGLSFPSSVRLSGDLYHPDDNLLDDRGLIDPSMESSASSSSSSSSSAASSRPIYVHPHMANSAYSSSGSSSPSQFDDRGSSLRIRTNSGPEDVGGDEEDLIKISKVMEERGELHVEQEDINSFIYEEHLNNLEGYLLKRHTNKPKKWSRRYFRLHNNRLIEYKDKDKFRPTSLSKSSSSSPAPRAKSLSPSTITLLSEVSCIIPIEFGESEAGGRDNVFQIEMAGKGQDSIFLAANSDIQMGLWVSAMYHSINQSLRSAVESESSSSAVASAQPKITQGVLLHKNRMKKWKPRWFSVSNGFLIGKKTSDDKKYKTKLPLFESTVEGYRPEKHNYSAFRLKSKAGQDIKLKASQEKDMLLWVNAILLEKHNVEDTINDITA